MKPFLTVHLFPPLHEHLLNLLKQLSPKEWNLQTIAPKWKVRDVVAHLIHGYIRGISSSRDGYLLPPDKPINSYADLINFLNQKNAHWIEAAKDISPPLMIQMADLTGRIYYQHLETLDPQDPAIFSVAWAGEELSGNWFHIAREYTEQWHHQQQIRLAVGQDQLLLEKEFYLPYVRASMYALPHHYRSVPPQSGSAVSFRVPEIDEEWYLLGKDDHWELVDQKPDDIICSVDIPADIAWRIFTKGISQQEALGRIMMNGDQTYGRHIVSMLAVMA